MDELGSTSEYHKQSLVEAGIDPQRLSDGELEYIEGIRGGLDTVDIVDAAILPEETLKRLEINNPEGMACIVVSVDRMPSPDDWGFSKPVLEVDDLRRKFPPYRTLVVYEGGDVPSYGDEFMLDEPRTEDLTGTIRTDLEYVLLAIENDRVNGEQTGNKNTFDIDDPNIGYRPEGVPDDLIFALLDDAEKFSTFTITDFHHESCPVWVKKNGVNAGGDEDGVLIVNLQKLTQRHEIAFAAINLMDRWADAAPFEAFIYTVDRWGKLSFYESAEDVFKGPNQDKELPIFAVVVKAHG